MKLIQYSEKYAKYTLFGSYRYCMRSRHYTKCDLLNIILTMHPISKSIAHTYDKVHKSNRISLISFFMELLNSQTIDATRYAIYASTAKRQANFNEDHTNSIFSAASIDSKS